MGETTKTAGRQQRRRERTRGRLLEAARDLFAEQGVEATTIAAIAERADVGFGSFYNHFESKDQIAVAAIEALLAEVGPTIVAATSGLEDPAERVSAAHRYLIARARREPVWAWLVLRLDVAFPLAKDALIAYARGDLEDGILGGRFSPADSEVVLAASAGALLGVVRGVVERELEGDADVRHADGVLRMLGLSPDDAAEVAARELPEQLRVTAGEERT